jgi:hypothetical protein
MKARKRRPQSKAMEIPTWKSGGEDTDVPMLELPAGTCSFCLRDVEGPGEGVVCESCRGRVPLVRCFFDFFFRGIRRGVDSGWFWCRNLSGTRITGEGVDFGMTGRRALDSRRM